MRILITGMSGLLGSFLSDRLRKDGIESRGLDRTLFLKLSSDAQVQFLRSYDVIVHAAASTNVEKNELFPSEAYRDNVGLTLALAIAASKAECRLIFISSTGVYGNNNGGLPHIETETIFPSTIHHRCKAIAESICRDTVKDCVILRVGWLFGSPKFEGGGFLRTIFREAEVCERNNDVLRANFGQIGSPTSVVDVTSVILLLVESHLVGTFNLVSGGIVSRLEYVQEICDANNFSVKVEGVAPEYFKRVAPVSQNEGADANLLLDLLQIRFDDWRKSLRSLC